MNKNWWKDDAADVPSIRTTPPGPVSQKMHSNTSKYMRGLSSQVKLFPVCFDKGYGISLTDVDGNKYLDFSSTRGVPWYVRTKKLSKVGIMGNPTKATAEKGRRMLEIMIAHLVRFVEEVKSSRVEDLFQKKY